MRSRLSTMSALRVTSGHPRARRAGHRSRRFRRRVIAKAEWTKGEANPRFIVTSLIDADGDYLCFGSSHACCRRRYQLSRAGLADTAAVGLRTLVCSGRGAPALSRTPREIEPHSRYP